MKDKEQQLILKKLLLNSGGRGRLWAALLALCIGTTLLLLSVMIWWNFEELLHGKRDNDSLGSTFMTVSKKVTDENMGHAAQTVFSPQEIEALKHAPQVQDVGALTSNYFPAYAFISTKVQFATDMFLEGVPDRFIDKMPADWHWQPGDRDVPIIISSEFLNLYNYGFALSRGLPQLSEATIKALYFELKIGPQQETYLAHVVGFSDRISSVLVPQSFIAYGNEQFGSSTAIAPSRLIVKANDPSDRAFVQYLQAHNYTTNTEQLRWSRLRAIIDVVSAATGGLAILLLGIGTLVFILFIELTIAKAQQSLQLLLQIGYGPRFLTRFMISRFLPLVIGTAVFAAVVAIAVQIGVSLWAQKQSLFLAMIPGIPVWAALAISTLILLWLVTRSIRKAIQ